MTENNRQFDIMLPKIVIKDKEEFRVVSTPLGENKFHNLLVNSIYKYQEGNNVGK